MPYAVTKAAVEHECLKAAVDGLDVVIAISCAILGPSISSRRAWARCSSTTANGRLRRYIPGGFEFVAARDIVEGHVLAMRKGRAGQRYIFNTGFMTLDALFELYSEITGRRSHSVCLRQ